MNKFLFIGVFLLAIVGCSSGSSGGASSDVGEIRLEVTPERIQVGSLAFVNLDFVEINFDDVDSEGLTIKFVLPPEVEFIAGSAVIFLDDGARLLEPLFLGDAPRGTFVFFSVDADLLQDSDIANFQLDVRALEESRASFIEVDVDRASIGGFDPGRPGFDREAEVEIEITGEDE